MARRLPEILADLDRAMAATDTASSLFEKHVPALQAQRFMREALGVVAIELALRRLDAPLPRPATENHVM